MTVIFSKIDFLAASTVAKLQVIECNWDTIPTKALLILCFLCAFLKMKPLTAYFGNFCYCYDSYFHCQPPISTLLGGSDCSGGKSHCLLLICFLFFPILFLHLDHMPEKRDSSCHNIPQKRPKKAKQHNRRIWMWSRFTVSGGSFSSLYVALELLD